MSLGSVGNIYSRGEISPARLRAVLSLSGLLAGRPTIAGIENLGKVPRSRRLVVATTHLTDLDIPLAARALDSHLDLAIVDMLPNHDVIKRPGQAILSKLASEKNFIPVDYSVDKQGNETAGLFNPRNFTPMLNAIDSGKALVIAAHEPSPDRKFTKPGVGASYLAAVTGAMILPVAVNLEASGNVGMSETKIQTFFARPDASVSVGGPVELPEGPDVGQLGTLMEKRHQGDRLVCSEIEEFHLIKNYLHAQSEALLDQLKALSAAQ